MLRTLFAIFLLLVFVATAVQSDAAADRMFPPPPAPYVHPRVFVTSAEIPELKQRLTTGDYATNITPWLKTKVTNQVNNGYLRMVADLTLDPANITDAQINDVFFDYGEFDSHDLAITALWGAIFVNGDADYVAGADTTAIAAATNYAIIAEDIYNRYVASDYVGLSAETITAIEDHWDRQSDYEFKLQHIRRNGGLGLALAYDMLYNDMTAAEQNQIRTALSIGTSGWNIRGGDDTNPVGMDGNAVSNHYGYQGDQAVMLAAIYGETGFSQTDWDAIVKVVQNYLRVGFYASGYPIEDSYGPDLGLREGSRALIALARQGENEFELRRDAMLNIGVALAHDVESVPDGALIGGESGGNYAFSPSSPSAENPNPTYPTFYIVWKHVFPDDPTIDWLYQWRLGDDYKRVLKSQSTVDYAFFGQDAGVSESNPLDLTHYFPQRGKFVTRDVSAEPVLSSIEVTATQFAFDARPDAFNIGHDKAGRGYFSLNALGRRWVIHLNFRDVRTSDESSTMHIDGVGQAYKSPSVQLIDAPVDDGALVTAAADLAYAYNWQWNEPWTNSDTATPRPDGSDPNWEHETIDPATFFPAGLAPDWLGSSLWDDENMGYNGMWMWRRPHLPVQKAYRSVAFARTTYPFVLIADDIRQDNASHLYESLMQLPFDLDQMTVNGNDAILWKSGETQRLLVRVLQAEGTGLSFTNEPFTTSVTAMDARRLRIGVTAVEPELKVMLWPHEDGMALPTTTWNGDQSQLTVNGDGIEQMVILVDDSTGYTQFGNGMPPTSIGLHSSNSGQAEISPITTILLLVTALLVIARTVMQTIQGSSDSAICSVSSNESALL